MFVFLCNALQMGDKSCIRKNKRYTLSQRVKKYCKPINMFSLYAVAMCLHFFFNNNTKHIKNTSVFSVWMSIFKCWQRKDYMINVLKTLCMLNICMQVINSFVYTAVKLVLLPLLWK